MIDIIGQINDTHREVGAGHPPAGGGPTVRLRRRYQAPVEDVWDACTSAERIGRWFLPITGDLRPGGSFQLEGNARGEIVQCEPPHLLRVTWVFGDGPPSRVQVRLSPGTAGDTELELQHSGIGDPAMWARFGPGAAGVGWDLALLGLRLHLPGGQKREGEAEEWLRSPEGREFISRSSSAWGEAFTASGASAAEAASAVRHTTEFYAPPASPNGGAGPA